MQRTRGPHIGLLIETLAIFESQNPQREVVGDVWGASRTKHNGIPVAQGFQVDGAQAIVQIFVLSEVFARI